MPIKPYHNAIVEKVHDVRTLRACDICEGFGNTSSMLEFRERAATRYRHGRCHILTEGWQQFLSLPREQHNRMTLDDLGVEHMKALLQHWDSVRDTSWRQETSQ